MSIFTSFKTGIDKIPGILKEKKEDANRFIEQTLSDIEIQDPEEIDPLIPSGVELGEKVGSITPGKEFVRGGAFSFILDDLSQENERLQQESQQFHFEIMDNIREARQQGDTERLERYKSIARQTGNEDLLFENILEDAPSDRQVIASAAELALFPALGLRPGTSLSAGKLASPARSNIDKTMLAINKKAKLAELGKLGKFAKGTALPIAREALIGSGFFALIKAQEEDATTEDIVQAAEMGGLLGGGLAGLFIGAGKALNKLSGPAKRLANKLVNNAEQIRKRQETKVASQIEKNLSFIGRKKRGVKEFVADQFLKGVQQARQFKARFIDRFSPLKRIEDALVEINDGPLPEKHKVYRDARLLDSLISADAERKVVGFSDELRAYNDVFDEARAYLVQLDLIDRARLGNPVPGNQSLDELKLGLRQLIEEIGPQKMQKVGKVRDIVRKYNRGLLQEKLEAGLISKAEMETLLKTHPNYVPHNVIMDIEERGARFVAGGSMNVAKTDLMRAVGSTKNIEDPLVAMIQRTPIHSTVVERNKLLNNLVRAGEQAPELGIRKITSRDALNKTEDSISLFRNGEKEMWAVPKDVGVAIKNLDALSVTSEGWFRFVTAPQRLLKKGATQFNPSFAVPNKFRDQQTAALTAESFINSLADRYGASTAKQISFTRDEIAQMYKDAGGIGASIFREGEQAIFDRFARDGIAKMVTDKNPLKLLEKMNSELEQSTRLVVFKRALQRGLSPRDAALAARDATIDFAKMGSWMKPLNQAIPFLNARVQGFINLPRAFAKRPETFARMQLYTAAYPTIALHKHNRRFESYNNISTYLKSRYWVIMTGETEAVNSYTGEKMTTPQFITIPKGEGQILVSAPIQHFLDKADNADYRTTSEMLAETLGSASPLEFQTFGQSNLWGSFISQLGPLATIPYGLASNKHPFFGGDIVPEQRLEAAEELQKRPSTPESTQKLADIMGVAPARLEFVFNSFGGLPRDVQRSADIAFGLYKGEDVREDIAEESISGTEFGFFTELPVSRRVFREANDFYSPEAEFRREQKAEIRSDILTREIGMRDRADEIWRKMNRFEKKEERLNYLNSLGDELTPEIRKRLFQLRTTRQSVEALNKNDRVELRARYINMRLSEMKTRGIGKEERFEFLNNLDDAGILTDEVRKFISVIQSQ